MNSSLLLETFEGYNSVTDRQRHSSFWEENTNEQTVLDGIACEAKVVQDLVRSITRYPHKWRKFGGGASTQAATGAKWIKHLSPKRTWTIALSWVGRAVCQGTGSAVCLLLTQPLSVGQRFWYSHRCFVEQLFLTGSCGGVDYPLHSLWSHPPLHCGCISSALCTSAVWTPTGFPRVSIDLAYSNSAMSCIDPKQNHGGEATDIISLRLKIPPQLPTSDTSSHF